MLKNKLKSKKGITLIALIVTIVVLLILAGVSISLVLGENGIISKAKEARDKYAQAVENDQVELGKLENLLKSELVNSENGGTNTEPEEPIIPEPPFAKVEEGKKANENSTINGQAPSANNPIIPEGYIPINTDTTSWGYGTKAPEQNDVDHGLVITDSVDENGNSNGNEWVWIPVPAVTVMYETASGENAEGYTLCGTSGDDAVKTKLYSKAGITGIISGQIRTTPGKSGYREPDLVVRNGNEYDAVPKNRATAGFTKTENGTTRTMTVKEMAEAMVKNYEDMIASIGKYKGFYVGRYELSSAGEQKNQPTLTNATWYNLYKKCTELKASDKVKTEMIWGIQWDVVCNWITSTNIDKSVTNASNWGNYSDYNTANNYTEGNEKYEAGAGLKQNTGSSEYWKANNLYDIAGNCWEWTQEAVFENWRVGRGGAYNYRASSAAGYWARRQLSGRQPKRTRF